MPLFVIGPPRSGTTIVTQTLNAHDQIKIFDEVSLIDVLEFGPSIVGKLRAFLMERGCYDDFRATAQEIDDPVVALGKVLASITAPRMIWGEKNPMYATRLEALRQGFPGARMLFLLRDPRQVVNSYLVHRESPSRSPMDFWIKDSVSEALGLVESCLEPLAAPPQADLTVLRYEAFIADPKAMLDGVFADWAIQFPEDALFAPHGAPESVGDHQFFRRGAPLPWKVGNLSALQPDMAPKARLDAHDPAWRRVEDLARQFGYA